MTVLKIQIESDVAKLRQVRLYHITYFWLLGAVLLEKLASYQLVKKFLTFYGTRKFFTAFTNARHLSLTSEYHRMHYEMKFTRKISIFYWSCFMYSPFLFDHIQEFLTASGDVHNWLPHRALGHGELETWHRQEKRAAPLIITGLIKKVLSVRSSHYWQTRKWKIFRRMLSVKLFAT